MGDAVPARSAGEAGCPRRLAARASPRSPATRCGPSSRCRRPRLRSVRIRTAPVPAADHEVGVVGCGVAGSCGRDVWPPPDVFERPGLAMHADRVAKHQRPYRLPTGDGRVEGVANRRAQRVQVGACWRGAGDERGFGPLLPVQKVSCAFTTITSTLCCVAGRCPPMVLSGAGSPNPSTSSVAGGTWTSNALATAWVAEVKPHGVLSHTGAGSTPARSARSRTGWVPVRPTAGAEPRSRYGAGR